MTSPSLSSIDCEGSKHQTSERRSLATSKFPTYASYCRRTTTSPGCGVGGSAVVEAGVGAAVEAGVGGIAVGSGLGVCGSAVDGEGNDGSGPGDGEPLELVLEF
jgi:hypothetical protein